MIGLLGLLCASCTGRAAPLASGVPPANVATYRRLAGEVAGNLQRTVGGSADRTEKIWWVQAEGLNALLMHTLYGRETPRYWAAFCQQWQFIQQHQTDTHCGGWYATVERDGTAQPGRAKSDGWTEAYHQGRALMNVSATLRRLAH